jgi:hypothetical protein
VCPFSKAEEPPREDTGETAGALPVLPQPSESFKERAGTGTTPVPAWEICNQIGLLFRQAAGGTFWLRRKKLVGSYFFFSAASPNFLALEWHAESVSFFDELIKGRKKPLIEKGYVEVAEKPGLGIELDERAAYKYRKRGEPFFDQPA